MDIPGFPDAADFDNSKKHETKASWGWKRAAMEGGQNYGTDLKVPDGMVVVGYVPHIKSDHNTKGDPVIRPYIENRGMFNIPKGISVGHRLTPPDRPGGPSASFTGEVTMTFVHESDWWPIASKGTH